MMCFVWLQRLQLPLYVVHANYAAGGIKRHRLREAQLWQYDKPEYYDVPQLLSFDMHTLQPPSNWNKLLTKQRIQFHIKNVGVQLQQVTPTCPFLYPWHGTMAHHLACMYMTTVSLDGTCSLPADMP